MVHWKRDKLIKLPLSRVILAEFKFYKKQVCHVRVHDTLIDLSMGFEPTWSKDKLRDASESILLHALYNRAQRGAQRCAKQSW